VIWFRHTDPRYPFLWEGDEQPPARWHGAGEGPAHYLADTPDGAWAEFLRHEEIQSADDLAGVRRAIWAIEVDDTEIEALPRLRPSPTRPLLGGQASYPACRALARRLRNRGHRGLRARTAALLPGGAHGWRVDAGLEAGPVRQGWTLVLFGRRPDLVGWSAAHEGRPDARVLPLVRPFGED